MDMSTSIDALPDAGNVMLPPEFESELSQLPQKIQEQPLFDVSEQERMPTPSPYMSIEPKEESLDIQKMFLSPEFVLFLVILFVADNRILNKWIGKIPLDILSKPGLLQTLIKILLLGVAFVLIKVYVL